MRILGLDLGSKTLGVAVSDELGWTAQGIETIKINEESRDYQLGRLSDIIEQHSVEKIVLGMPKNMNGTIGPRAEASQRFSEILTKKFNLPVILWDERLTTMAAEKMLISADVSRKKESKSLIRWQQ